MLLLLLPSLLLSDDDEDDGWMIMGWICFGPLSCCCYCFLYIRKWIERGKKQVVVLLLEVKKQTSKNCNPFS